MLRDGTKALRYGGRALESMQETKFIIYRRYGLWYGYSRGFLNAGFIFVRIACERKAYGIIISSVKKILTDRNHDEWLCYGNIYVMIGEGKWNFQY